MQKSQGVLMTSPLNKLDGMSLFLFHFMSETSLQICKQVGAIYFCLSLRLVWCPSSMGQQKVSQTLNCPPRYDCHGEADYSNINILTSYMYIQYSMEI